MAVSFLTPAGNLVYREECTLLEGEVHTFDLRTLATGCYLVKVYFMNHDRHGYGMIIK